MELAHIHPKPGTRIQLKQAFPYTIPQGLSEGQEVTVLEGKDTSGGMFVQDDMKKDFRIPRQCAVLEPIYFIGGKWRREQHPLVVAEFRKKVEELQRTEGRWQAGIERVCQENLDYARKVVAEADRRASLQDSQQAHRGN